MSAQGQKRKAPLAEADVNTQPAKKPTTRKKASTKTASTAAKKFKYSDEKTVGLLLLFPGPSRDVS